MPPYAHETPRLYLQKLTPEQHLDDFHEIWSNPRTLDWIQFPAPETKAESLVFMHSTLPSAANPDIDKYAILLKPLPENPQPWVNGKGEPKMIGMTGTNRWCGQGLETGYAMNPGFWGKGYAGEAFRGFLEMYWRLEERKWIRQLVAKADPGNVASEKILVKEGARRGEVLKAWYEAPIQKGVKRDLYCWYLDRPGVADKDLENWKEEVKRQMDRKTELESAKVETE